MSRLLKFLAAILVGTFIGNCAGSYLSAAPMVVPPQVVEVQDPIPQWLKGEQGHVVVRVIVRRDGRVGRILTNSANDKLKSWYELAVRASRFTPATVDGKPVEAIVTIRYEYTVKSTVKVTADP